ncbi:DUF418 domain-containing protein [Corynebacterium glaucum]|uniref:DUF418 domain-containing protein n=1 Tax=Corynebacterium glaucum TaxID=187491 RepID=UPI00265A5FB6|nr:DUF418 domain-containing protein [Corynebacterium glaucum]
MRTSNTSISNRMLSLDVVRGIALCGIAFVNVQQQWILYPNPDAETPAYMWLDLLARQRFFPVFTFLFGIGFCMIMQSARRRGVSEPRVMARRLAPLLLLGIAHQFLHPGEALMFYAEFGFVVLFPLTFVRDTQRRRTIATWLGVILTLAGAPLGGILVIPGLLLLGFAFAEWSLPLRLDQDPTPAAYALIGLLPLTAAMEYLQYSSYGTQQYPFVASVAGLVYAATWAALAVVLVRTPLRPFLGAVFAPLGRMALTNYIVATFVIIGARIALGIPRLPDVVTNDMFLTGFAVMAAMLVVQSLLSTLWLKYFGQGPLEKAWRWLTWNAGGGPKPVGPEPATPEPVTAPPAPDASHAATTPEPRNAAPQSAPGRTA